MIEIQFKSLNEPGAFVAPATIAPPSQTEENGDWSALVAFPAMGLPEIKIFGVDPIGALENALLTIRKSVEGQYEVVKIS